MKFMDEDYFAEIKTGNGIDRDLAATSNDRIKKAVLELDNLKSAIFSLEKTMVGIDKENSKLQKKIFWLSIIGVIFTGTQIIQIVDILCRWFK